ncbi:putative Spindle pole protein [Giardia duodenalis]|uniref:Spindle pole protein n=1 Tax=Giardia intestinalis (strain ATCC 50803 / WB clone C6) TaxID=184922 RepID=A8BDI9_GIAIC|nr:putative Spindle pole protein [Giardia intestinalis]KAE8304247.1 putative Spindle pole protein [Giardia intestinalis]|eukprot:XP_001707800.1 Spindle pole protein, putative [Giardia lamblia ATCC 50803]
MESTVLDRVPDPQPSDVHLPFTGRSRSVVETMESSLSLQASAALQTLSLISSDSRLTSKQCHLAKEIESGLFEKVKVLTDKVFGRLKDRIANRKMYVLFEEQLKCNTKTDHLVPKSVLPIFEDHIDAASNSLYSQIYSIVHASTQALFDASQKQEPLPTSRVTELESLVYQLRLQIEQVQQDYTIATDRFATEQANALSELTRLREQLWQKHKYTTEYEPDFNPYITPSKWGTIGLLTGGTSGIEDRKAILTRLLDDERTKCAELRNRITQLEIQIYAKNQQVDLLPVLYEEIETLKQKLADYDNILHNYEESKNIELSMFQAKEEALKEELSRLQSRLSQSSDQARSSKAAVAELTKRLSQKDLSLPVSTSSQRKLEDELENILSGNCPLPKSEDTSRATSSSQPLQSREGSHRTHKRMSSVADIGIDSCSNSDNISISSINTSAKSTRSTKEKKKSKRNSKDEKRKTTTEQSKDALTANRRGTASHHNQRGEQSKEKQNVLSKVMKKDVLDRRPTTEPFDAVDVMDATEAASHDPSILLDNPMQSEISNLRMQIEALQEENSKLRDSYATLENTIAEIKEQAYMDANIHISQKDLHRIQPHEDLTTGTDQPDKVQMKQDKKEELHLLKQKLMKKHLKKERARKRITAFVLTKERFDEFREEVDNDKTLIPRVDYRLVANKTLAPEDVYTIIGSVSTRPSILTHGDFLHSIDYRILEHTVSCVEDFVNKKFRDEVSMDGTCSEYMWFSESCSDSRRNDFDGLDSDLEELDNDSKDKEVSLSSQKAKQLKDSLSHSLESSPLTHCSSTIRQTDNGEYTDIPKSLLSLTEKPRSKGSDHSVGGDVGGGHKDIAKDEIKLRLYHEYVHIDPSELSSEALASLLEMDNQKKQNIRSIITQLLFDNSTINPAILNGGLHLLVKSDQGTPANVYMTNRQGHEAVDDSIESDRPMQKTNHETDTVLSEHDSEPLRLTSERMELESRQQDGRPNADTSRKLYQSGMLRVVANATETVRDILPNKPLYISSASDKEYVMGRSRSKGKATSQPSLPGDSLGSLEPQPQTQTQDGTPRRERPCIIHTMQSAVLRQGIEALLHNNKLTLSDTKLCNDSGVDLEAVNGLTKVVITETGDTFIGSSYIGNAKQLTLDDRITNFYSALINANIIRKNNIGTVPVVSADNGERDTDLTASMLTSHSTEVGQSTFTLKDIYLKSNVRITTNPGAPLLYDGDQTMQRGTFGSLSIKSYSPIHSDYVELDRICTSIKQNVKVDVAEALRDIRMILKMLGHDPQLFDIKLINCADRLEHKHSCPTTLDTHELTDSLKALSKDDKLTLFLEAILAKQITWGDLKAVFEHASPIMNYLMDLCSQLSRNSDIRNKPLVDDLVEEDKCLDELSNILFASQIFARSIEGVTGVSSADLSTNTADLKRFLEALPSDQQQLIYEIAKLLKDQQSTAVIPSESLTSSPSKDQAENPIMQLLNALTHINYDAIVQILFTRIQSSSKREDSFDKYDTIKDPAHISDGVDQDLPTLENQVLGIFTDSEWQDLETSIPPETLKFIKDKLILEQEKLDELSMLKQQLYILRQAEHAARLSYEAPISEETQCPEGARISDVAICSTCGQEITRSSRASSAPGVRSLGRLPSQSGTEGEAIRLDFLPGSDLCLDHLDTSTNPSASKVSREACSNRDGDVSRLHPVLAPDVANAAVTTLITGNRSRYAEHLPIMGFVGKKVNQKYRQLLIKNKERAKELQERLGLLSIPQQNTRHPINYQYNIMNIPVAFAARTPHVVGPNATNFLGMSMEISMLSKEGKAQIVSLSEETDNFLRRQLHLSQKDYSSKQHMIRAKRASDAVQSVITHYVRKCPLYHKLNWVIPDDPRDIFIRLYQNARELREKYERRFQAKLLLEADLFNRYRQARVYVPGSGISKHSQSGLPIHQPMKENPSLVTDLSMSAHTPQATYVCTDSVVPDTALTGDGDSSQLRDCTRSTDSSLVNSVPQGKPPTDLTIPASSPRLLLSGIQGSQLGKADSNSRLYIPEYERYNKQAHVSSIIAGSTVMGKPIIPTPSLQNNKARYPPLYSSTCDSYSPRDSCAQLHVSGIHLGSKTVHSYDSNTSGKLSVQAKIHSQIDDSRLDELSKSVTLLSSSVELAKSGNASLTPGASAKICGRLPTKPLKSICASTQQAEEPVNISITNITDMFISEETKQSGSKEAPQISDAFTGVHRSGSIRKSAALAFRTSDAQTEARLSVGSRSQH